VHEGFECSGQLRLFQKFHLQHPWPTLAVIFAKGERYSTLVAQRRFEQGRRAGFAQLLFNPPAAFVKKIHLLSKASATARTAW